MKNTYFQLNNFHRKNRLKCDTSFQQNFIHNLKFRHDLKTGLSSVTLFNGKPDCVWNGVRVNNFLQKCFPGNSKTKPENSLKTEVTACRVMERPKFMNDVNIPLISFHECIWINKFLIFSVCLSVSIYNQRLFLFPFSF